MLLGVKGLNLPLLSLQEPLVVVTGGTPCPAKLVKAFIHGCSGALIHRVNALLCGGLLLGEGCPLLSLRAAELLTECALVLLVLVLLLLLLGV